MVDAITFTQTKQYALIAIFLPKIYRRIRFGLKKNVFIFFRDIYYSKKYCRSIFVYSAKTKNRRGDQIPPKEISICGKKRTPILFGSHMARPRNCQLKQRSAETQKGAGSFTCRTSSASRKLKDEL